MAACEQALSSAPSCLSLLLTHLNRGDTVVALDRVA
jgi:hypothetical protein